MVAIFPFSSFITFSISANNGLFEYNDSFLNKVVELANRNKILIIFDEIITGFRLNWGWSSLLTRKKHINTKDLEGYFGYNLVLRKGLAIIRIIKPD